MDHGHGHEVALPPIGKVMCVECEVVISPTGAGYTLPRPLCRSCLEWEADGGPVPPPPAPAPRAVYGSSYPRPALPAYVVARVLDFRLAYMDDCGEWTYDPREAAAYLFAEAMRRAKVTGRCLVLAATAVDETTAVVTAAAEAWLDGAPYSALGAAAKARYTAVNKVLGNWCRDVRKVETTINSAHRPG